MISKNTDQSQLESARFNPSPPPGQAQLVVDEAGHHQRLDLFLATHAAMSRGKARALLQAGSVYVDRKRVKIASKPVFLGSRIDVYLQPPESRPRPTPIPILYQDHDILVVNKPPGLPVQPTLETHRGTVLEALSHQLDRPESSLLVVHRLDRETGGALALGLSPAGAAFLSEQIRNHQLHREYHVLVWGHFSTILGIPDSIIPLDSPGAWELHHYVRHAKSRTTRLPGNEPRMEARVFHGPPRHLEQIAISRVQLLETRHQTSLLSVQLRTGRTHQIRVQLAACGFPVVGDRRYHRADRTANSHFPLALHASRMALNTRSNTRLELVAPFSEALRQLFEVESSPMESLRREQSHASSPIRADRRLADGQF